MKKAMKLVWMVLFALPMISLTACGDDEDLVNNDGDVINLKDYSDLLDKKANEVKEQMGIPFTDEDAYGIYYDDVPDKNVEAVNVMFEINEKSEYGGYKTYEKSVYVEVDLLNFKEDEVFNYCNKKYGDLLGMWQGMYVFKKGNMYIWYEYNFDEEINEISYVRKNVWDDAYGEIKPTKSLDEDIYNTIKSFKAAQKALRK